MIQEQDEIVEIRQRNSHTNITRHVSKKIYDEKVKHAEILLAEKNRGYLSPRERMELEGLLVKTNWRLSTNPERILERITELQDAGIPQIFGIRPQNQKGNFPIVDLLIQFPSGKLVQRWKAQHATRGRYKRKRGKSTTIIHPSNLEDVLDFRTLAYDGDSLSELLVREFHDYAASRGEAILENTLIALKLVEQELRGVEPKERKYKEYNKGDTLDFIGQRFWHVHYSPEDRIRIAEDYAEALAKGNLPNIKHRKRMRMLFPDIMPSEQDITIQRNAQSMAECKERKCYLGMPQIVLFDSTYGTTYIDQMKAHIEEMCEAIIEKDELGIFERLEDMHEQIRVPYGLLYLNEFRDVVTQKRIEVLEAMDDKTLADYFDNRYRRMSIGHRQFVAEGSLDRQFRTLLKERSEDLS